MIVGREALSLATSAFLAALTSAGVAFVIYRLAARLGLIDFPSDRSSHVRPTPRGGGLGLLAGAGIGTIVLALLGYLPGPSLLALLLATVAIAVLGAVDDVRSLPPYYRLLAQAVIAAALTVALGAVDRLPLPPPLDVDLGWLGIPLTVLWLVAVTNFYNFMDGIDGLATGQGVATSAGIALAGFSAGATDFVVIVAGAGVGFFLLNRPPARIFLGDVGSTALGFLLAATPLLASHGDRHRALLAVAIGLSIFLLDPTVTLLRRLRTPAKLATAHREHAYQRLAAAHNRHGPTTAYLVGAGLVLSIVGGLSYRAGGPGWPYVALGVAAYCLLVVQVARAAPSVLNRDRETGA